MYEGDVIKDQLNTSFCKKYWWTYYTNRDEVHMLLLEDIILVDAIECKGFMLHRSKTQYMECMFSKRWNKIGVVKLDGREIWKSEYFWYPESLIHKDWEIKEGVNHKIRVW